MYSIVLQFYMNIKIKIIKPGLRSLGSKILFFYFTIRGKVSIIRDDRLTFTFLLTNSGVKSFLEYMIRAIFESFEF